MQLSSLQIRKRVKPRNCFALSLKQHCNALPNPIISFIQWKFLHVRCSLDYELWQPLNFPYVLNLTWGSLGFCKNWTCTLQANLDCDTSTRFPNQCQELPAIKFSSPPLLLTCVIKNSPRPHLIAIVFKCAANNIWKREHWFCFGLCPPRLSSFKVLRKTKEKIILSDFFDKTDRIDNLLKPWKYLLYLSHTMA